MKKSILTAASIVAITLSGAAWAADNVPNTGDATVDTKAEAKADWNNMKADAKQDWNNLKAKVSTESSEASDKTAAAYQDTKARLFGEGAEGSAPATLDINGRASASSMIGAPVYNSKHDKVGTVSDIIIDHDGRAQLVVISDGGFAGIGDKLAAFDYGLIVSQNKDGDIFMPLTDDMVSKVTPFSYDPKDATDGKNVRLIPSDGYSVAQLMKANLEDQNGKKLAKIDNITFDGGEAKNVIVAFDQTLGMGGEKAAFDFDDVQVLRTSADDVDVRLNARQSAEFEAFKGDTKTN